MKKKIIVAPIACHCKLSNLVNQIQKSAARFTVPAAADNRRQLPMAS
ncbi:MAG: hypothetical protein LPK21_03810 [Hymenobacteraceae bacterium]|nr:hypothetical protein [Hymenobacteraceae bacterium]